MEVEKMQDARKIRLEISFKAKKLLMIYKTMLKNCLK